MVLSDQWTVRAYSSADAWSPGPLLLNHPPKDNFSIKSYPPDQQTALNSLVRYVVIITFHLLIFVCFAARGSARAGHPALSADKTDGELRSRLPAGQWLGHEAGRREFQPSQGESIALSCQ